MSKDTDAPIDLNLYPDGTILSLDQVIAWVGMARSTFFARRDEGEDPLLMVPFRGGKGCFAEDVRSWYRGLAQ